MRLTALPPCRTVADGHAAAGERNPRADPTNLSMTAHQPGVGTFLTSTVAVDVAAAALAEGGH